MFTLTTVIAAAVYLLFLSTFMTTHNLASTLLFKTLPLLIAVALAIMAAKMSGLL